VAIWVLQGRAFPSQVGKHSRQVKQKENAKKNLIISSAEQDS
jgi:hypothetical protein